MKVNVKKVRTEARLPYRGSAFAAGYDLHACVGEPIVIEPGESFKFATGLAFELPNGYFGGVFARSGLSTNRGLRPANCVAVVDSDYRGEVFVPLRNDSTEPQTIYPDERIAQLVILPFLAVDFNEVDELSETERGKGGFGSTGR